MGTAAVVKAVGAMVEVVMAMGDVEEVETVLVVADTAVAGLPVWVTAAELVAVRRARAVVVARALVTVVAARVVAHAAVAMVAAADWAEAWVAGATEVENAAV